MNAQAEYCAHDERLARLQSFVGQPISYAPDGLHGTTEGVCYGVCEDGWLQVRSGRVCFELPAEFCRVVS